MSSADPWGSTGGHRDPPLPLVGQCVGVSPGDKIGPLTVREAAYRITAKLDKQTVSAMGQEIPLRSGMLVNADILLEQRSLLEWIFEPVLQLRSRL